MLSSIISRSTAAVGGTPFRLNKCTALGSAGKDKEVRDKAAAALKEKEEKEKAEKENADFQSQIGRASCRERV